MAVVHTVNRFFALLEQLLLKICGVKDIHLLQVLLLQHDQLHHNDVEVYQSIVEPLLLLQSFVVFHCQQIGGAHLQGELANHFFVRILLNLHLLFLISFAICYLNDVIPEGTHI